MSGDPFDKRRAGRNHVTLDPAVASILTPGGPPEAEPKRRSKRRPHEAERKYRMISVTFPSPGWKDAVGDLAQRWGVRTSDVMTYAFAYLMRAVEDGEVGQPGLWQVDFQDRAGDVLDLPWEP